MLNRTVVVIDDDLRVRESLVNLLASFGYVVDSYESAELFLDSSTWSTAGCIITDVEMKQMSGLQLLQHLKNRNCSIPVVIITGKLSENPDNLYLEKGAVAFFRKPIDGDVLVDLLARLRLKRNSEPS